MVSGPTLLSGPGSIASMSETACPLGGTLTATRVANRTGLLVLEVRTTVPLRTSNSATVLLKKTTRPPALKRCTSLLPVVGVLSESSTTTSTRWAGISCASRSTLSARIFSVTGTIREISWREAVILIFAVGTITSAAPPNVPATNNMANSRIPWVTTWLCGKKRCSEFGTNRRAGSKRAIGSMSLEAIHRLRWACSMLLNATNPISLAICRNC